MINFVQSSVAELEGKLTNKDLWAYLRKSLVPEITDSAILPLDNGGKGKVEITITKAISPDEYKITLMNATEYDARLSMEKNRDLKKLDDNLTFLFSTIINNKWMFLGEVKQKTKNISILIIYLEEVNIFYYTILTNEQKSIMEKFQFRLN